MFMQEDEGVECYLTDSNSAKIDKVLITGSPRGDRELPWTLESYL